MTWRGISSNELDGAEMDLNRWGLQKFTRLSDRCRNFQEFLGEVLEGERSLIHENAKQDEAPLFAVRDDVERILLTPVPSRGLQSRRAENVFEGLAPFFEAGFLLRAKAETGTRLLEMFLFGRVFVPPDSDGASVRLAIPEIEPGSVFKAPIRPVLRAFNLDSVKALHDANAFLMMPAPGVTILLICNRPHPWQQGVIERTRDVLREIFTKQIAPPQVSKMKGALKKGLFR